MEKDKDIIEIIVDETVGSEDIICDKEQKTAVSLKNRIYDYLSSLSNDLTPLFVKISAAAAVLVIIAALFAGALIPKSDSALNSRLAAYREKDTAYLEAKGAYDAAKNELDKLNSRLEDTQKELEEFNQSRDSIDKISQQNDELTVKKEQLQSEVNTKQATLSSLETSLNSYTSTTITWPSGKYTVGENIAEGKYTIMGAGSIVISNSGSARVNKALKSDGESFALNNGDIIKIDGSARLIPE